MNPIILCTSGAKGEKSPLTRLSGSARGEEREKKPLCHGVFGTKLEGNKSKPFLFIKQGGTEGRRPGWKTTRVGAGGRG